MSHASNRTFSLAILQSLYFTQKRKIFQLVSKCMYPFHAEQEFILLLSLLPTELEKQAQQNIHFRYTYGIRIICQQIAIPLFTHLIGKGHSWKGDKLGQSEWVKVGTNWGIRKGSKFGTGHCGIARRGVTLSQLIGRVWTQWLSMAIGSARTPFKKHNLSLLPRSTCQNQVLFPSAPIINHETRDFRTKHTEKDFNLYEIYGYLGMHVKFTNLL